MPFGIPGAFAAVAVGAIIGWSSTWLGMPSDSVLPGVVGWAISLPWPTLAWLDAWQAAVPYLSIALPFALVTTIGGIDNTESAAAAGDEYRARDILLTEALATVLAGTCGGVVQNTPYIGHPAYKAMGARAGYTLATALVIGLGAAVGALSWLVALLPEAAVAPILIFIGLEITAQGFMASPARHGPAVAMWFIPVAAALVVIQTGGLLAGIGKTAADLAGEAAATFRTVSVLGNGFILTALLWSSAVAFIIDARLLLAGAVFALASLASLCGLIHSPLANGALFWPWAPPAAVTVHLAGAYGVAAALCWLASLGAPGSRRTARPTDSSH
jgi:AGZA family xanthine/uracil permease-like MFS transporter